MDEKDDEKSADAAAGDHESRASARATKNTAATAAGEIVGKLASLVVFAALAREGGATELGYYVFALAWGEVAMTPVGLGIDRYMLRLIAADRTRLDELFYNALFLKVTRGAAIVVVAIAVALALGYDGDRMVVIAVVTVGMFIDTLARTHMSVYNAFERAELVALTIMAQRIGAAVLAVAALVAGLGVVGVAVAFTVGAVIRLALSQVLLARRLRSPALELPAAARADLRRNSVPFIAQDLFGLVLSRADIVLLSLLTTPAVVGSYGAAYRLFEATTFVTTALSGAFSAMYTYLGPDTRPTLRTVFGRSIKAAIVILVPAAMILGILAEPVVEVFYGAKLAEAAEPLRLLAPVVLLFPLYVLAASLIVSRHDAWLLLRIMGVVAVVNIGLNLALVPAHGDVGAAIAMLASTALYAVVALVAATRLAGGMDVARVTIGPLAGAVAMAAPMLALESSLALALPAGLAAFVVVTAAIERVVDPEALAYAARLVRRVLRPRAGGVPA
jgi:O-antigen/teichoic acid export membrane protein